MSSAMRPALESPSSRYGAAKWAGRAWGAAWAAGAARPTSPAANAPVSRDRLQGMGSPRCRGKKAGTAEKSAGRHVHVVDDELLREGRVAVRVAGPVAADREVEHEVEGMVEDPLVTVDVG